MSNVMFGIGSPVRGGRGRHLRCEVDLNTAGKGGARSGTGRRIAQRKSSAAMRSRSNDVKWML
jgi:hypothetical protein